MKQRSQIKESKKGDGIQGDFNQCKVQPEIETEPKKKKKLSTSKKLSAMIAQTFRQQMISILENALNFAKKTDTLDFQTDIRKMEKDLFQFDQSSNENPIGYSQTNSESESVSHLPIIRNQGGFTSYQSQFRSQFKSNGSSQLNQANDENIVSIPSETSQNSSKPQRHQVKFDEQSSVYSSSESSVSFDEIQDIVSDSIQSLVQKSSQLEHQDFVKKITDSIKHKSIKKKEKQMKQIIQVSGDSINQHAFSGYFGEISENSSENCSRNQQSEIKNSYKLEIKDSQNISEELKFSLKQEIQPCKDQKLELFSFSLDEPLGKQEANETEFTHIQSNIAQQSKSKSQRIKQKRKQKDTLGQNQDKSKQFTIQEL